MPIVVTLSEVAEKLQQLDDSQTIFAKRSPDWSATSEAILCAPPEDDSDPPEAAGYDYVLEVDLAKDAVRVWSEWRDGKQPTTAEKSEAIVYYAEHDAWLPLDGEKPVEVDPVVAKEQFLAEHGGLGEERCCWRGCSETAG